MIKNYTDLEVWQKGIKLVKEVYLITKEFPKEELFGLTSQMRRSSISIPSNIAEGWMHSYTKEYIHFLYHALGSCGELDTQVRICEELRYLNRLEVITLYENINHVGRMLNNLIKGLRKKEFGL